MKLTFLGGADEIGASATLIEVAGIRILIDCGLRHHERAGERLPALAGIEGKLDAIIITHAHLDHTGALPVVAQCYPNTPIYLTAPTLGIISVLLLDAAKIMAMGLEADGEIPIYGQAQIEAALSACIPVGFDTRVKLGEDVELIFRPAGHILGAASAVLESSEGTLVMSGDIFATDQITVPGLTVPAKEPDIFVIEATYGGRQHVSRSLEEVRLIERIRAVVENKGSVIIPAFAVGRSQELILLVSRAIEKGELPKVPVFVDGMVKSVCGVYSSYPELMSPWLKGRIKTKGNPFFYDKGPALPIYDARTRKEAAMVRPAIIISSSGMVTVGSPSAYYAAELAKDPRCLVAISGYQDEESPGRRMLELAEQGGGELRTANGAVELRCQIEAYKFSAHSDGNQIINELQAARPRKVVLVHGDGGAREALAGDLARLGFRDIELPILGRQIEVSGKRRKRAQVLFTATETRAAAETVTEVAETATASVLSTASEVVNQGLPVIATEQITDEQFFTLAERLLERDSTSRVYTIAELLSAAGYAPDAITPEEIGRVAQMLGSKKSCFAQDRKNRALWRLRVLPGGRIWRPVQNNLTQSDIEKMIRAAIGNDGSLYKIGIHQLTRTVILKFHYPKPAIKRHDETIARLREETGWRIEVQAEPHQQAMIKKALSLIPAEWQPSTPSIHLANEVVSVNVSSGDPQLIDNMAERFAIQTGFQLVIKLPEIKRQQNGNGDGNEHGQESEQRSEPMEINKAYARIREVFSDKKHLPIRIGLKEGMIELAFITPEVGSRYQPLMESLAKETGYQIGIRPSPDQIKLQQIARQLIPAAWNVKKEPSINLADKEIVVKVASGLGSSYKAMGIDESFYEQTGWRLVVRRD